MARKLKLGVIGMSDGNGHPYSWSAIFNGYNTQEMKKCPFPVILKYLSKESFPENFLTEHGEVTHIWTQDYELSKHIALSTYIPNVCINVEEMLGNVDAILLARDDAENHLKHCNIFLNAGLPIYIDKPFALDISSALKLWETSIYDNQIFTCSALQFAKEFHIDYKKIGKVKMVWASTPKSWVKYAVHIIEPVLKILGDQGKISKVVPIMQGASVEWESGVSCVFKTTNNISSPIWIRVQGQIGYKDMYFEDSFYAFKKALKRFIDVINKKKPNLSKSLTLQMVEILEKSKG